MTNAIAIVGRPNVGKSALFNRIAGRRIAIVHDMPGVTRDRVSAEVEWLGAPFTLLDTGGLGLLKGERSADIITNAACDQVDVALESASVIILVVNVQEGVVPLDQEVAAKLRRSHKPVLVAINKVDTSLLDTETLEFARLGFEHLFPVSAVHGRGIDALMNAAMKRLPPTPEIPGPTPDSQDPKAPAPARGTPASPWKLAIVGRPNVGKSSLINSLTQSKRVIVSPIPGTTRDSVDVPFDVDTGGHRQSYLLIDTAGMRKARRVNDSIEFFSVKRAEESISRSDLCLLVLDAETGVTEQDKKIAGKIVDEKRACVVVINKWDLVTQAVREARIKEIKKRTDDKKRDRRATPMTTLGEFGEWVQGQLFFLDYAPVIFTSALDGFQLDRLLEAVRYVAAQLQQQIPTALLNRTIQDAMLKRQPVSAGGQRLKFFYATQVRTAPPTFLLFVNRNELFSDQYMKYLSGELRKAFGYEGCPLVIVPKARPKKVASIRQRTSKPPPRRS